MIAQNSPLTTVQYDGQIVISVGTSARAKVWIKSDTTWQRFLERIAIPKVTFETVEQFSTAPPKVRTRIKDVGGYVGGTLQDTGRGKNDVVSRKLITLDLDDVADIQALWLDFCLMFNCAGVLHTTHSHTPEKPKARLIIPTQQDMTPKNYSIVAEHIADELGLGQFDKTTFEPNRLMFWPSVCKDGQLDYVYLVNDAPWLNVVPILQLRKEKELANILSKDDPCRIPGIVGEFCKKYTVEEAIDNFLTDVYTQVSPGRYRLLDSDSQGGLVIYEGGKYCYSHHAKDPIQGKLTHAFNLVCIHKFGHEFDPIEAMTNWIAENNLCPVPDMATELTLNRRGLPETTVSNMRKILNTDGSVSNTFYLDELAGKIMVYGDFPWIGLMDRVGLEWQDTDDAGLREFFENKYGIHDRLKAMDAVALTALEHKVHPVRDFLTGITWDGTPRADTLLIDFLEADDTPYVRAVTRKALLGAVARVMMPGSKHDHVLVLVGPQGCRKSTTIGKLGGKWYTDSLYTMQGKEAYELLQGYWIVEISEMAAARKSDIEMIKQFISKQSDNFRAAYDRRTMNHPRQCVFIGSTNDEEFLRDFTGNRRFWPVNVNKSAEKVYEGLTDDYIRQVWGEMMIAYKAGEKWYLTEKQEEVAAEVQKEHVQTSSFQGSVMEFIESDVPKNWNSTSLSDRIRLYATGFNDPDKMVKRDKICALEIWVECLGGSIKDFTRQRAVELNHILKNMVGWEPKQMRFCKDYGLQRGYARVIK